MIRNAADERGRLLADVAQLPSDAFVEFHVAIDDVPFDFARFRTAQGSDRAALVNERKHSLQHAYVAATSSLQHDGATVMARTWIVAGLIVRAKAEHVPRVANNPYVLSVSPVQEANELLDRWDGYEYTRELRTEEMFQNLPEPYNGQIGGRELRIGIHEGENSAYGNGLHCSHEGWEDYENGPSRLKVARRCGSSHCLQGLLCSTSSTSQLHGTLVSSIAAASIEQGQDPSYPGSQTVSQQTRSGHAQEADVYFWVELDGTCGKLLALQDALEEGVDVLNMSWGHSGSAACEPSYDWCNINDALLNLFNAGTFLVAASGNNFTQGPQAGDCKVNWPATRSVVMSVGALDSNDQGDGIEDLYRDTSYSFGQMQIQIHGGAYKQVPMVDLVAPEDIDGQLLGVSTYDTAGATGTSMAAPHVTATHALTREWMLDWSWPEADDPREEFVNLLLMGDRYDGSLSSTTSESLTTVSETTGFGRLQAHWPGADSIGSTGEWLPFSSTISQSSTHFWELPGNPQPSSIEGVKLAVAWFDFDYTNVARIKVELIDSCPGQPIEILKTANLKQVMRKQLQLTSDSDIHGRCLWVRLYGTNVPSGGEDYYGAVYTYSNNALEH